MKYKKKPVVVEAVQWTNSIESLFNIMELCKGIPAEAQAPITRSHGDCLTVHTLEGDMVALPNDFIIQGVEGEFYPCKPDIFRETYEKVE